MKITQHKLTSYRHSKSYKRLTLCLITLCLLASSCQESNDNEDSSDFSTIIVENGRFVPEEILISENDGFFIINSEDHPITLKSTRIESSFLDEGELDLSIISSGESLFVDTSAINKDDPLYIFDENLNETMSTPELKITFE